MTTVKFVEFKSQSTNPMSPKVRDISPEELYEKKSQVKMIDVRRPDEWVGEYGHIEGAQLMTLDTLPARIHELPKDTTIVFVCRSGARSAQATAFAVDHGLSNSFNLRGGMIEWDSKKFEVVQRNGSK